MQQEMNIKLGNYCKDKITGIEGTVTYIAHNKYSATKIGLQPSGVTRDGKMIDPEWFDWNQVEYIKDGDVEPLDHGDPLFGYGDKVKDEITAFEGIIVGMSLHINGCIRYDVAPTTLDKDGAPRRNMGYDQGRLQIVTKQEPVIAPPKTNGPMDESIDLNNKPSR